MVTKISDGHPPHCSGHGAGHNASASDWLERLPAGRQNRYDSGEMICRPGMTHNRVFLLNSGSARICLSAEHRELTLGCLKPGSIYVTHTRAWVETLEPTTITSWPIEQLTLLIVEAPEIAITAMREVGQMLQQATSLIEDLAFRSVESRLARYLLLEESTQQRQTIELTGQTELLASLLGTSRQTLSTLLNRMIRDGIVARPDRQHLTLLDTLRLQQLASVS
tara:strand:- start:6430 stop:7098 length:669 start_codon:yes stop_codon:yes gene_type:complete